NRPSAEFPVAAVNAMLPLSANPARKCGNSNVSLDPGTGSPFVITFCVAAPGWRTKNPCVEVPSCAPKAAWPGELSGIDKLGTNVVGWFSPGSVSPATTISLRAPAGVYKKAPSTPVAVVGGLQSRHLVELVNATCPALLRGEGPLLFNVVHWNCAVDPGTASPGATTF